MSDDPPMGPLAQMMIENSELIDEAIEAYGPASVAEFFISAGTGIAFVYDLAIGDGGQIVATPKEGTE